MIHDGRHDASDIRRNNNNLNIQDFKTSMCQINKGGHQPGMTSRASSATQSRQFLLGQIFLQSPSQNLFFHHAPMLQIQLFSLRQPSPASLSAKHHSHFSIPSSYPAPS